MPRKVIGHAENYPQARAMLILLRAGNRNPNLKFWAKKWQNKQKWSIIEFHMTPQEWAYAERYRRR